MADVTLTPAAPPAGLSPARKGLLFGFAAVTIWGGYLALARLGVSTGLTPIDFALLRYGVAGLVLLPWFVLHARTFWPEIGLGRAALLTLLAGPPFMLFAVGGYAYAPLAHGAVIQPAAMVILTSVLAAVVLRDLPQRERVIGLAIMLVGLALIAGPGLFGGSALTPLGDAMFAVAGGLWAAFTVATRRFGIKALPATAVVSVLSALVIVPVHLLTQDFSRIASLPPAALATQIVVQGVLSGVVAVILFTRATELVGPARAAVFPALVPAAAIIIGIPVTGEWPTEGPLAGLALVTFGLFVALGVLKLSRR